MDVAAAVGAAGVVDVVVVAAGLDVPVAAGLGVTPSDVSNAPMSHGALRGSPRWSVPPPAAGQAPPAPIAGLPARQRLRRGGPTVALQGSEPGIGVPEVAAAGESASRPTLQVVTP
ncbi:MAG TPA: hypothetical protein VGL20_15130 [Candidatus Dormibacteraeota bacterium]